MSTFTNEIDLLNASLSGNKEAFGTIVENYQSLVCSITYSATGDFAKSEELAQETFIKAWKELKQLKDKGKFRAWLCTITRNLLRQSIRKQKKDVIDSAQPIENAATSETSETQPDQIAITKEQQTVIWQALQEIPETYREPMVLFYREEQSIKQVAVQLDLSEEVTKQRLSRGRKLLKAEMSTLVEDILGKTTPKKAFTIAVLAALPALVPQAASAAIAGVATKGTPVVAKAAFSTTLSGVVLGPLLGLLGGLFGSWMSIKNTSSTQEKHFMIKCALAMWCEIVLLFLVIGLCSLLAIKGVMPKKAYWLVFILMMTAHSILLIPAILLINRRQRQIRQEEGTCIKPDYHKVEISKASIYGAFGGGIFGPICWIVSLLCVTRDWLTIIVVIVAAFLIFIISTNRVLQKREKFWRIIVWDMISLGVLNLVVVNLRWHKWIAEIPKFQKYSLWKINLFIIAVMSCLILLTVSIEYYKKYRKNRQDKIN